MQRFLGKASVCSVQLTFGPLGWFKDAYHDKYETGGVQVVSSAEDFL
jgi:hypothetical protein